MKTTLKKTIEHGTDLNLEGIIIDNKEYSLDIDNTENMLVLSFNRQDYKIVIKGGQIIFGRLLDKIDICPNQVESLQVCKKDGTLLWRTESYNSDKDYDLFGVEFGAKREDY